MRLTLRTLLAYLDDVLEPAEAKELGQRIQDSEFATNLVHRVRESMRREKLGAPRLEGRGAGLDANTVAEYLDNTISSERVVDFEKYCLESEVHLSEVACCHQVLALVLGEPALVDPAARRRIYGLLEEYESGGAREPKRTAKAQQVASDGGRAYGVADEPPAPEPQPEAESESQPASLRRRAPVPDYLRDEAGSISAWWKVAAAGLVAVLLVCVVVMAVGPIWWGSDTETNGSRIANGSADGPVDLGPDPKPPLKLPADGGPQGKKEPPPPVGDGGPQIKPNGHAKIGIEQLPQPLVAVEDPVGKEPKIKTPKQVDPPGKIAALTSLQTVLFRFDRQAENWSRVPASGAMAAGDLLLCPPACLNQLALRGDVNLRMVGNTRLELTRPDAAAVSPGIRLHYGRLLMMTAGDPQSPLTIQAGNRQATVTFANAGAVLAIEVRLQRPLGTDPQTVASRVVVDLIAKGNGSILWQESGAEPLTIDAPGRHTLGLAEGEEPPTGVPEWTEFRDPFTRVEELGRRVLEENLRGEAARNLNEALMEWDVDRRREVRTMAYRWQIAIDRFDPAVAALANADRRESWKSISEQLRFAVARDPQAASAVLRALETARGEKAAGLYRILWDYSDEQLKAGEAKRLVDYLDHQDLDYRVLSSWCLSDLTGTGFSVFYRPEAPADLREQHVRRWRQKLDLGQIVRKKDSKKP